MSGHDQEIHDLKAGVNCATILERQAWRLDQRASTRRCWKYRRGAGEVLIVNHEGRGWWDPQGDRKGDVFALLQFLEPGMTFGQACRALRRLSGIVPSFPAAVAARSGSAPDVPPAQRWRARPPLSPGSRTWRYLTDARALDPPCWLRHHGRTRCARGHMAAPGSRTATPMELWPGSRCVGRTTGASRRAAARPCSSCPRIAVRCNPVHASGGAGGADRRHEPGRHRGAAGGHAVCGHCRRHGARHDRGAADIAVRPGLAARGGPGRRHGRGRGGRALCGHSQAARRRWRACGGNASCRSTAARTGTRWRSPVGQQPSNAGTGATKR